MVYPNINAYDDVNQLVHGESLSSLQACQVSVTLFFTVWLFNILASFAANGVTENNSAVMSDIGELSRSASYFSASPTSYWTLLQSLVMSSDAQALCLEYCQSKRWTSVPLSTVLALKSTLALGGWLFCNID